jgi:uracil-DNA glycosylase
MSLHLDARQRAMLQEMGVQVWSPAPTISHTNHAPLMPAPVTTAPPQAAAVAAAPRPQTAKPPATLAPMPAAAPHNSGHALPQPVLHPPQRLYPSTDGTNHGQIWLLVAEGEPDTDPLADEAGALLHNMLQALQLHQPPAQVFFCGVELTSSSFTSALQTPPQSVLPTYLEQVQPTMVLLMGRLAARAVLGRQEPLGQLRALPHHIGPYPAIVTYEAPYLLRHGKYKAAAWADLCRARALVQAVGQP